MSKITNGSPEYFVAEARCQANRKVPVTRFMNNIVYSFL